MKTDLIITSDINRTAEDFFSLIEQPPKTRSLRHFITKACYVYAHRGISYVAMLC